MSTSIRSRAANVIPSGGVRRNTQPAPIKILHNQPRYHARFLVANANVEAAKVRKANRERRVAEPPEGKQSLVEKMKKRGVAIEIRPTRREKGITIRQPKLSVFNIVGPAIVPKVDDRASGRVVRASVDAGCWWQRVWGFAFFPGYVDCEFSYLFGLFLAIFWGCNVQGWFFVT